MELFLHRVLSHSSFSLKAGSVLRNGLYQPVSLDEQGVKEHLRTLLTRDPVIFLERYGDLLLASDWSLFSTAPPALELRSYFQKYVVDASIPPTHATVRNRRFNRMNQLIDERDFFSLENMRDRHPTLYHEYIGQFTDDDPTSCGSGLLSDALFSAMDRSRHREQLETALLDDSTEDMEQEETDDEQNIMKDLIAMNSEATKRSTRKQKSGSRSPSVCSDESEFESSDEEEEAEAKDDPKHVEISAAELQNNKDIFLRIMKERFLDGDDAAFFDYGSVDRNERLDDLEKIGRDAEDAYFDEEEEAEIHTQPETQIGNGDGTKKTDSQVPDYMDFDLSTNGQFETRR
eukprot:GILK01010465.1.p1 GENE.GILK01010465.1~~GILK01010465.1.p1  ORF type:complete len:358 (-),score=67.98 GILK01010465.1:168-1205(-)